MVSLILVLISASFSQAQVTPSVIISSNASNNSLCRGTAVTFTATPTNGGATPTYQWKRNGTNIFTGSQIALNNIQVNDQIKVVMTTSLNAADVTSTTATSNTITLTVNNLPSVVSTTPAFITSCATAGSATIYAVPTTGSVIDWYASTSSITPLLSSSNSYTTPTISSTTTYYPVARDTVTGCQSNGLTAENMAINMGPNNAYIQTAKTVTGSFTIEFWLKPAGASSAGCGGANWRCGEGLVDANTTITSDYDFGITMFNSYVAFGMGNGAGNPDVTIVTTSYVNNKTWKHIAATWDSTTGAMKLYVNGNLQASAIGSTASRNGQSLMRLGSLLQAPGNGYYGYFSGSLDEVRVWSKVRTQAEIQSNYTTNLNGREDGLVQYYNFNQGIPGNVYNGTQTTLYDITPNGYNGSLNQFMGLGTSGTQGNWWGTFDLGFDPAKYPVVVTKITIPTVTSTTGATICGSSGSTTLSATASSGAKIDWYDAASGGTLLATGTSSYTTPTLSATTTYYAEARDTIAGCVSTSRTAVTATVGAIPTAGITNNTGSTLLTCTRTSISVTATGGSTYSWSNSLGASANASITAAGTYTVTVTSAVGCQATSSITVTRDATAPTAGITNNTGSTILNCTRTSISVTATGGSTYAWSNSLGTSAAASITSPGTYTVTVTGANGCTATSSIAVTRDITTPTAGITNNTGSTLLTCTTTAISVTATGGASYSWSNSLGTSANANIIVAGTYTVTVTGANGCTATSSITTTQNITAPTAGITNNTGSTTLNCLRTSISVTATGGSTYLWSSSLGASASASISAAGNYAVTATAANGCTSTASVIVTQDITAPTSGITNNTGSTILNCSTTAVSVTATGGGSYLWSNSLGSSANASITAAGIYTVIVTGSNSCTATASITTTQDITAPTAGITNNTGTTTLTCATTAISVTATGGSTYLWSNSLGSSASASITAAGTYTVSAIAANGCTSVATMTVTQDIPTAGITNNTGETILTCTTAAISVTATGGSSYVWSNSLGSSASASITAPGTYTVTATGLNGCTSTTSITITQNITAPTASITNNTSSTLLTCSRTAISVTATGGSTYVWSNSLGTSASASISAPGTYIVTATAANGCTSTASLTITQNIAVPTAPVVTNGSRCGAGAVTLSATSGAGTVVDWYASSSAITPFLTATTTYTTPSLSADTTYYAVARDTVTGCTSAMPRVSNALDFDGINDIVNAGNAISLQLNRGTIEAWIKTANAGSNYRAIVTKPYAFGLFLDNNVLIAYDWNSSSKISTGINLGDNSWHHVALSFDAAPNVQIANIYIDGIVRAQANFNISSQHDSLYIGENPSGVVQQFTGTIDEVRVWNVAHTQSQIAASMYSELSGTEFGLVAYYNFNQGVAGGTNTTITSLADVTSNANNASIRNFTLTGNASNFVDGPTLAPVTVVTAIIHPLPIVASSVDGSLICATGTTSLSAAASAGAKIDWYAVSAGGTALLTGSNTYTTPTISATTVYYAEARDTVTGCVSATRTAVTATVSALPTAGITNNTGSTLLTCSRTAISVTATGGASYVWSSSLGSSAAASITSPGTYTVTAIAANSCVATASVTITQDIATSTGHTTASACNTFDWYGNTYTNSGTPTHTLTNGSGCDSVVTLHLTITYSNTGSSAATACNTYTWSGSTYTTSGSYTKTLTNAASCDSVHTLILTINSSNTGSSSATANNSYTWTGTTYTTSGTYTKTLTNNASCDSMHTLSLTINYSNTGSSSLTACDSYTWNGTTFTASGSYIYTYTNVANADSVHTLHLTINSSNTGTTTASTCNTYTWTSNSNTTYTTSGAFIQTFTNAAGCDSVHTLSLTINSSNTGSSVATACNTYTWSGSTYTTSGSYTKTLTNAASCDSVHTLTLTINSSNTGSSSATANNSYTWTGTTYTISGTYTKTLTNNASCDSMHTLSLTINYSNTGSSSLTACDSYTWNGTTFTASGSYIYTYTNVANADSVHTLSLTINHSNTGSSSATACNTYTWSGSTYTTSGTYTKNLTNAAGCDSVHTLSLTINYSTSSSVTVSQLGCYTWALNAVTYTISGNYSLTYTNAIGCDSIVTLYLTITPGVYLNAKAILSGPYVAAAALMHDSLRVNGLIPTTEPYTASPYNKTAVGGTSGETVSNAILNVSGNNAIVDWVFIELRNALTNSTVVANKRALMQRDGDIVSCTDGTSPVYFPTVANGNYYVSIKHRNHLGVMSLNAISFSGCSISSIDFTTSNAVYSLTTTSLPQRKQIGAVYTLWSGDANNNKNVKYNGLSNDKEGLIYTIGISTPNNTLSGVYRVEDVNMDGKIRYANTDNDKSVILNNVGVSTPNNLYYQHTPN